MKKQHRRPAQESEQPFVCAAPMTRLMGKSQPKKDEPPPRITADRYAEGRRRAGGLARRVSIKRRR